MRPTMTRLFAFVAALSLTACASSPPGDSSSQVEVFFTDSSPSQPLEEIGPVVTRHWSIKQGIRELQGEARKLGADAIIEVIYGEYLPAAGKGVDATRSRRRVNEGYAQVVFEIEGVAVRWVAKDRPDI